MATLKTCGFYCAPLEPKNINFILVLGYLIAEYKQNFFTTLKILEKVSAEVSSHQPFLYIFSH